MKSEKDDPFHEAKQLAREKYALISEEIKYLNEDLEDLDNSVNVVKKNLYKFNITTEELENRANSLKNIRTVLNEIASSLTYKALNYSRSVKGEYDAVMHFNKKDRKRNTHEMKNKCLTYKYVAIKRQDNDLDELAESAERLHNAAITINTELKDQQKLLDELENEMDYSS